MDTTDSKIDFTDPAVQTRLLALGVLDGWNAEDSAAVNRKSNVASLPDDGFISVHATPPDCALVPVITN